MTSEYETQRLHRLRNSIADVLTSIGTDLSGPDRDRLCTALAISNRLITEHNGSTPPSVFPTEPPPHPSGTNTDRAARSVRRAR